MLGLVVYRLEFIKEYSYSPTVGLHPVILAAVYCIPS